MRRGILSHTGGTQDARDEENECEVDKDHTQISLAVFWIDSVVHNPFHVMMRPKHWSLDLSIALATSASVTLLLFIGIANPTMPVAFAELGWT